MKGIELIFRCQRLDFLNRSEKEKLVTLAKSVVPLVLECTSGVEDFWVFQHSIISKVAIENHSPEQVVHMVNQLSILSQIDSWHIVAGHLDTRALRALASAHRSACRAVRLESGGSYFGWVPAEEPPVQDGSPVDSTGDSSQSRS